MAAYVYIDVSQKQEYIYKNSKLSDNLYNSFVIKAVTEELDENLQIFIGSSNSKNILSLKKYLSSSSDLQQKYEFMYSGGGNSIIRFETREIAVQFIKGYSYEVLKVYPDLELYISLVDEEDLEIKNNLNQDKSIRELLALKCDELKDKRRARFKRWSYGIEDVREEGSIKDHNAIENRDENFKKKTRELLYSKFIDRLSGVATLTSELKDYKKEDEGKSYIGVISIDGNKMGEMVGKTESFKELGQLSKKIDEIYLNAIVWAMKNYYLRLNQPAPLLLCTPILQAGDDICLIVEAEHAIEITADIIKAIQMISIEEPNRTVLEKYIGPGYLSACGGVAIARNTYPFFEMVKIAEDLCHRAKEKIYVKKLDTDVHSQESFLNWEIIESQVSKKIEYERYVKNRNVKEKYHIKPLCIDQSQPLVNDLFSFDAFKKIVEEIQSAQENEAKKLSNSFLEQLKKEIYSGVEAYKLFIDRSLQKKSLKSLGESTLIEAMDEYMLISSYKGEYGLNQYVLNDVIETLPFITKKGGMGSATRENISDQD